MYLFIILCLCLTGPRSSIDHELKDGSTALVYYKNEIDQLDPTKLTLPGWDASYSPDESQ